MPNIGRNQPCPCGSGKKYKKCCGAFAAVEAPWHSDESQATLKQHMDEMDEMDEMNALNARREKQQGFGRPIIAAKLDHGHQMVAVGKRVYWSQKWKTFHDFLKDHLFALLGKEWGEAELVKPKEQRHQIFRWFDQATEATMRLGTKAGEIHLAPMTGAIRAFINLAYNIYLIAHHTEGDGEDAIVRGYVTRLRSARPDDFVGVLFETYAAAALLKAGFKLEFEDERDGSMSHVEFVALYPKTRACLQLREERKGIGGGTFGVLARRGIPKSANV